jgi:hypothetical protein
VAWFEDLTPYSYLGRERRAALNVGWLGVGHAFSTGRTDPGFVTALMEMCVQSRVNVTRGWQECVFCPTDPQELRKHYPIRVVHAGNEYALGDAEIRVTHPDGTVFAAPNLIAHYVQTHKYEPPRKFIDAVLEAAI